MSPFSSSLSDTMIDSFTTSHLLMSLEESRVKLDVWAEAQKEQADAIASAYEARRLKEQAAIDSQVSELLEVELERGLRANGSESTLNLAKRRTQLLQEQHGLEEEIDFLQQQHSKREAEVQALQRKEAKERSKANEVLEHKTQVEEAKKTTVDDLTRGIINYKFLGLDFEKAHDDRLRFTFTQLDAGDPARTFTFVLNVNDEDTYQVEETIPPLHAGAVETLVAQLNDTDDLSVFCRGMRHAFSDTL